MFIKINGADGPSVEVIEIGETSIAADSRDNSLALLSVGKTPTGGDVTIAWRIEDAQALHQAFGYLISAHDGD